MDGTPAGGLPPLLAWGIVLVGWILPLAHVTVSRQGGPFTPPPGSGCPLGPRTGWLVMVLLLGPVGWLLYLRGRGKRRRGISA